MCVFCKIINGEIPSYKLYEDDFFIAILDRFPSALGHTLIIPKKHFDNIHSFETEYAEKLFPLAVKLSNRLDEILNPDGLNVLQNNGETAGQSVGHFHMHLIPRFKKDEISIKWNQADPPSSEFEKLVEKFKQN